MKKTRAKHSCRPTARISAGALSRALFWAASTTTTAVLRRLPQRPERRG